MSRSKNTENKRLGNMSVGEFLDIVEGVVDGKIRCAIDDLKANPPCAIDVKNHWVEHERLVAIIEKWPEHELALVRINALLDERLEDRKTFRKFVIRAIVGLLVMVLGAGAVWLLAKNIGIVAGATKIIGG